MVVRRKPTPVIVNARKKVELGLLERYGQEDLGIEGISITKNEALNERDYGSLVDQNKFEAAEIESANPIRLTGDIPLFANKNSIATSQTITTTSGYNYVTFGDITIDNGVTATISSGSSFRVI
mgnify:CR=1 FL=1